MYRHTLKNSLKFAICIIQYLIVYISTPIIAYIIYAYRYSFHIFLQFFLSAISRIKELLGKALYATFI